MEVDILFSKISTWFGLNHKESPKPLNFKCLSALYDTYRASCGVMSDYDLQYTSYFVEACEAMAFADNTSILEAKIRMLCAKA